MITETIEHLCPKCQSTPVVKNGKTKAGKQKYHCHSFSKSDEYHEFALQLFIHEYNVSSYEAAHLPGAISMPWDEVSRRLEELPRDTTIAAYCRGPYCVYADEALSLLAEQGWEVIRLEEGVAEWQQAGCLSVAGTGLPGTVASYRWPKTALWRCYCSAFRPARRTTAVSGSIHL